MAALKHNLVQFWNTPDVPQEVRFLMDSWKTETDFSYQRYDLKMADAFIAKEFDARTLAAFRTCAKPAMQADFFRYCALYKTAGVYVDADTKTAGGMVELIASAKRGLLMDRRGNIANDFLFFRHAGDSLLERVIAIAIHNIENRISNNVWVVTGPGIMTGLFNDPATRPLFDEFQIESNRVVREIVIPVWEMNYKNTAADWRQSGVANAASIFQETNE
jgi:mannosyltransferase OCH1-like enzyme